MTLVFRLIIAGSQTFHNYRVVKLFAKQFINMQVQRLRMLGHEEPIEIEYISGNAEGPDTLCKILAHEQGKEATIFEADWDKYGKAGGPIRNNEMAEYAANGDVVGGCIVFWDGESPGSDSMIGCAKKHKLNLLVVRV